MKFSRKLIKILLFLAGLLSGGILAVVIIVGGSYLDNCRYGSCYVRECKEYDPKVEVAIENYYNSRTGQYDNASNPCVEYGASYIPTKDFLLSQVLLWGFVGASGVGIFFGIMFISIYNSRMKKRCSEEKDSPND
jgi:hypothetical protein